MATMTRSEHVTALAAEHEAVPELLAGPTSRLRWLAVFTDDTGRVLRDYYDEGMRDLNAPEGALLLDWDDDLNQYAPPA